SNTPIDTATASNTSTVTSKPSETRTPTPTATFVNLTNCDLGYPRTSTTSCPRAATLFNESSVLVGFRPEGSAGNAANIQVFYSDEHALLLGANSVDGTSCPIQPTPAAPGCSADHPSTGCSAAADGSGRPLRPSLFV